MNDFSASNTKTDASAVLQEIWSHIAAVSLRNDLPALARVSSTTLHPSRSELYKHVKLTTRLVSSAVEDTGEEKDEDDEDSMSDEDDRSGDEIYAEADSKQIALIEALRKNNGELAARVETLELVGIEGLRPRTSDAAPRLCPILPLAVLGCMERLRCLQVNNHFPSSGKFYRNNFVAVMTAKCPLSEIRWELPSRGQLEFETMIPLELPTIQKIVWANADSWSNPFSFETFLSIVRASAATLTHLHILSRFSGMDEESLIEFYSQSRLPMLRDVQLPSVDGEDPESLATGLFLYKHPAIEHLRLGYDHGSESTIPDALFDEEMLSTPGALLPNLHGLWARACQVHYFVRHCPAVGENLVQLGVEIEEQDDSLYDFTTMLEDLKASGGLPMLKTLEYEGNQTLSLSTEQHLASFRRHMDAIAGLVPNLEELVPNIDSPLSLERFVKVFAKFKNIRSIHMKSRTDDCDRDIVLKLAKRCTKLEEIVLDRWFGPGMKGSLTAKIIRSSTSSVGVKFKFVDYTELL